MVIYQQHIELTKSEKRQLFYITGNNPAYIKTVQQMKDFINSQAATLQFAGPGACMARRLLFSFMPPTESYRKAS